MDSHDENRPKQHVSCRLGHTYFLLLFFVFFIYQLMVFVHLGCIYVLEARERVRMGGEDKNGPKRRQTRRLGHRYVFFKYINIFYLYFFSFLLLRPPVPMKRRPAGPNDARRIVWAISIF